MKSPPQAPPQTVDDLLRSAIDDLTQRLPSGWEAGRLPEPPGPDVPDAVVYVRAPDGTSALLLVEAKLNLDPRTASYAVEQLRSYTSEMRPTSANLRPAAMLVARYIPPRSRELLAEAGVSYADATGNLRVRLDNPVVFIQVDGAQANPWREEREIRTLGGAPAARVVRALCDWAPPQTAVQIVNRAKASTGSTYRVLDLLDREALISRSNGAVVEVDWPQLIRRWSEDYNFLRRNRTEAFVEPRGLGRLVERLAAGPALDYAVTGSLAAATAAQHTETRLATLFVENIETAASRLDLRPLPSGANVVLAEPFDSVVYERSWSRDGVRFCAYSQVVADLLTGPGRSPAEAEELIRWMATHDDAWRI